MPKIILSVLAALLISITAASASDMPENLSFKIKKNGIVYFVGVIQAINKQTVVKEWYEQIPFTSELVLYSKNNKTDVGTRNRSTAQEGYKLSVTGIELMDNRLYVSVNLEVKEITNWIKLATGKQSGNIFQPETSIQKYESSLMALLPNTLVNSNKVFANSGEPIPDDSLTDEKDQSLFEIEQGFAVEFIRK